MLHLTDQSIALKASDAASVSDQQQARVTALLGLGQHERALSEAKSDFNVATQKTAQRTIELMLTALQEGRGYEEAEQFKRQQILDMNSAELSDPSVLARIVVDAETYLHAIALLPQMPAYDKSLTRGNLLLLADKPDDAYEAFVQAAAESGLKGKKLFVPLEGIVRVLR